MTNPCLYRPGWISVIHYCTASWSLCCENFSLCRTLPHDWSLARDAATTSRRYYASSTGCLSESLLSSKWHAWFDVQVGTCLPDRWLLPRVWQYSALSAVSWRPDLHCTTNLQQLWWQNFCSRWTSFSGTLYKFICAIQTSPSDCLDDSWRDTFFGNHGHGALWLMIRNALKNIYLFTYLHLHPTDLAHEIRIHWMWMLAGFITFLVCISVLASDIIVNKKWNVATRLIYLPLAAVYSMFDRVTANRQRLVWQQQLNTALQQLAWMSVNMNEVATI